MNVVELFKHGFSYVACKSCGCDKFYVKIEENCFYSIICIRCGNEIYVELKPC